MVVALGTSAVRSEGMLPTKVEASRASVLPERVPVCASPCVETKPKIPERVACTADACPVTVLCAEPAAGQANKQVSRTAIAVATGRWRYFRCIHDSFRVHDVLDLAARKEEGGNPRCLVPIHAST